MIFGASESFTVCSKIGVWGNSKIVCRNPDVWEYSKIIVLLHQNYRLPTYKPVFSFSYFYLFKSLGGGGPHGKPCIIGKTHDTVRGLNTHRFYSILWQSFPTFPWLKFVVHKFSVQTAATKFTPQLNCSEMKSNNHRKSPLVLLPYSKLALLT